MSIAFLCPECGAPLLFEDTEAGLTRRCSDCREVVRVPLQFEAPSAPRKKAAPPPVPRAPSAPADVKVASPVATGFKMGIGVVLGAIVLVVVGWLVYVVGKELLLIATVGPREKAAMHYFELAQEAAQRGDERMTRGWLRMILKDYPETESAKGAREFLRKFYPSSLEAAEREEREREKEKSEK